MFNRLQADDGEVNFLLISTIVLGLCTIIFAVLAVYSWNNNRRTQNSLSSAKATAYKQGQTAQEAADKKAETAAAESPFRDYKAPDFYGNFDIKFPKNWNSYVIEDQNAQTQVDLTLNPEIVKVNKALTINTYAFRAQLINRTQAEILAGQYQPLIKAGKLTQKSVTVSGISGIWLDGKFDAQHNGVIVLIPVRDKTLEFIADTHDYLTEFNQILAQSTIVR